MSAPPERIALSHDVAPRTLGRVDLGLVSVASTVARVRFQGQTRLLPHGARRRAGPVLVPGPDESDGQYLMVALRAHVTRRKV